MARIDMENDIYRRMLPEGVVMERVTAESVLEEWADTMTIETGQKFDMVHAVRGFIDRAYEIIGKSGADPEWSDDGIVAFTIPSESPRAGMLGPLTETVRGIDVRSFLMAYRDDGWVVGNHDNVYSPQVWSGVQQRVFDDFMGNPAEGAYRILTKMRDPGTTNQVFANGYAFEYEGLYGEPWCPLDDGVPFWL